jgi:hypothetical protein
VRGHGQLTNPDENKATDHQALAVEIGCDRQDLL